MILNSDSYLAQGSSHKHCDDFSFVRSTSFNQINDITYAVISDGCSGSKNTDIGARLLSTIAVQCDFDDIDLFIDDVLFQARTTQKYLSLPNECLDATLFLTTIQNNIFNIKCFGDGSIIKIKNDNSIEFTYIEYPSGAPLYINYYKNSKRFELYKEKFGLQRKIYKYLMKDNSVIDSVVNTDDTGKPFIENGSTEDYKAIMVTSDGIASFIGSDKKSIELITLVQTLCDFKSFKGDFIQRRMNGFNNYCEKQGWKHTDDFSIAGIHIDNA